jgi:hypothetical protein
MPTILKTKNSVTTTVAPTSLEQGELAVNITDKKMWVGNAATTPVQLFGAGADGSFVNLAYTGTLTGGTGIVNLGSGQFYKDASGNVGIGTSSPSFPLDVAGAIRGNSWVGRANTSAPTADAFIYRPADNTLGLGTGNTERMRITSAGNVGIGTTSPSGKLHVSGGSNPQIVFDDAASRTYGIGVTSTAMSFYDVTASAERMRITSAGLVGIGCTPTQKLQVEDAGNVTIQLTKTGVASFSIINNGTAGTILQNEANPLFFYTSSTPRLSMDSVGNVRVYSSGTTSPTYDFSTLGEGLFFRYWDVSPTRTADLVAISNTPAGADTMMRFFTNQGGGAGTATEKMRINTSGDLLIGSGTSNTLDGARLQVFQTGDNCAVFRTTSSNYQIVCQGGQGSNTGNQVLFRYGNSVVGNIVSTSSTTAYNTSSDYRLKENVEPMTGALARVSALKPVTYKWKADGSNGEGFIAHELQAVVPDCVTGEKDAVETYIDEDGNEQTRIKPQGIDTSFLVATLTAAIQELKAEFDAYKATHP